jgi:hypothetical protein
VRACPQQVRWRWVPGAVLGAVLAAGLAACSSPSNALTGLTADQIASKAVADFGTVPAVTMSGAFSNSGQAFSIDITLTRSKGCTGLVSQGSSGSVRLIKVGSTLWIKPDGQFWATEGLTNASVLKAVSGKYVETGSGSSMAQLGDLCDVSQLVQAMGTSYHGMSKGATTTIAGQQALAINTANSGVLYVTVASAPRLLRVDGGSQGHLNFSYGPSPTLTPPPASETVNGAQYGF